MRSLPFGCVICGHSFLLEKTYGRSVSTIRIEGIDGDLYVHRHCKELYLYMPPEVSHRWEAFLPDGPLKELLRKKRAEYGASLIFERVESWNRHVKRDH